MNPETDVLVTHGATGALAAAFDAFVNLGDRVVLFDPCSPLFALGAKSRARPCGGCRRGPRTAAAGTSRRRSRRRCAARTMLVLSDPGNPTGGASRTKTSITSRGSRRPTTCSSTPTSRSRGSATTPAARLRQARRRGQAHPHGRFGDAGVRPRVAARRVARRSATSRSRLRPDAEPERTVRARGVPAGRGAVLAEPEPNSAACSTS